MTYALQDPAAAITRSVEWSEWLAAGDSIASTAWSIDPPGPVLADLGSAGTISSVTVSEMTRGQIYRLNGEMVSAFGETARQSIAIRCDFE
jgi:hypothetical protein